jgi:Asp-tRNA(Asn)/Glu-tRNA(Gln) amidotransferase A subunit family amidase
MARSVADAALLLEAMIDFDAGDPGARRFPDVMPSLLPGDPPAPLDGLRIGIYRDFFGAGDYPALDAVYDAAVARLEALGAQVIDPVTIDTSDAMFDAEYQAMLYEFKTGLNAYLASHPVPEDRDTLAALIAWNRDHAERVLTLFDQEIFLEAEEKGGLDESAYRQALADGPYRMREVLGAVLTGQRLDVLFTLANSFAWKTDWLAGDRFMAGSSSLAAMSVIDYEPAVRFHFVMLRVPGSKATVVSGPKIFAKPESK